MIQIISTHVLMLILDGDKTPSKFDNLLSYVKKEKKITHWNAAQFNKRDSTNGQEEI